MRRVAYALEDGDDLAKRALHLFLYLVHRVELRPNVTYLLIERNIVGSSMPRTT